MYQYQMQAQPHSPYAYYPVFQPYVSDVGPQMAGLSSSAGANRRDRAGHSAPVTMPVVGYSAPANRAAGLSGLVGQGNAFWPGGGYVVLPNAVAGMPGQASVRPPARPTRPAAMGGEDRRRAAARRGAVPRVT